MKKAIERYREELAAIQADGTYKNERYITTPQSAHISTTKASNVLNMCANNYLGLADDPRLIQAAKDSFDTWGYGLSSVRFICGTQEQHITLEKKLSQFLGKEDTIL